MRIEVLYNEYMNLYGDTGNIEYLKQCLGSKAEFVYTSLNEKPKFLTEDTSLLYLGPCTENHQEEIINILMPYRDEIKEKIEEGLVVLATGNAIEIFGKYIEKTDKSVIKALSVFNVYAVRVSDYRYNELCLGKMKEGIKLVGFKNQMSHLYGNDKKSFQTMLLGTGRNKDMKIEGIRYKNFYGTYLLGPVLPLNPPFAKMLLKQIGIDNPKIQFEDVATRAYEVRVNEFESLLAKTGDKRS